MDYLALALEQEQEQEKAPQEDRLTSVYPGFVKLIFSGLVRLTKRNVAGLGVLRSRAEIRKAKESQIIPKQKASEKEALEEEASAEEAQTEVATPGGERTIENVVRRLSQAASVTSVDLLSGEKTVERAASALLDGLRRTQAAAGLVQGQGRRISVTLPETEENASGWGPEALDRAVERDARRYGGGFALY